MASWEDLKDTDHRLEIIEKLRNAPITNWNATWLRCFICGDHCGNVDCRNLRVPYIAHLECVIEAPIHRISMTTGKQTKPQRAQNVEQWVRDFHATGEREFTVHDVRNWIASNAGPEFSYAGVRRICKELFETHPKGRFVAKEKLTHKVTSKRGRKVGALKRYTLNGRKRKGKR